MGKTNNGKSLPAVSSRRRKRKFKSGAQTASGLGTPADVRALRQRQKVSPHNIFSKKSLRRLEKFIHGQMLQPDSKDKVSAVSGKELELRMAKYLRCGLHLPGEDKWDGAYSRGPRTRLDSLEEIKSSQNINGKTPINLRTIMPATLFKEGESLKKFREQERGDLRGNYQQLGRRLLEHERASMEENLQSLMARYQQLAHLADGYNSELILAYSPRPGELLITVEPYLPRAEVADQFVWLRDPESSNIIAVLEQDYHQLYPDNIPQLKTQRILEWQCAGKCQGNIRYLPYNLPNREILESYKLRLPTVPAPSVDQYDAYMSIGAELLRHDMKLGIVRQPEELSNLGQLFQKKVLKNPRISQQLGAKGKSEKKAGSGKKQ